MEVKSVLIIFSNKNIRFEDNLYYASFSVPEHRLSVFLTNRNAQLGNAELLLGERLESQCSVKLTWPRLNTLPTADILSGKNARA